MTRTSGHLGIRDSRFQGRDATLVGPSNPMKIRSINGDVSSKPWRKRLLVGHRSYIPYCHCARMRPHGRRCARAGYDMSQRRLGCRRHRVPVVGCCIARIPRAAPMCLFASSFQGVDYIIRSHKEQPQTVFRLNEIVFGPSYDPSLSLTSQRRCCRRPPPFHPISRAP